VTRERCEASRARAYLSHRRRCDGAPTLWNLHSPLRNKHAPSSNMSTPKAPSMKSHPLPQKKLTISILEAYYTFVAPLHLWLCATLGSAYENEQGRFTGIQDFLDTTYVGCKTNPRRLKLSPSMSNMREVVDQAQFRLFNQARTNTILTLGYRIVRGPSLYRCFTENCRHMKKASEGNG